MGDFRVISNIRICFILLCIFIKSAIGTGLGKCPVYPQFPTYDIKKMTGTWFEVERSFYLMEISASCTELEVTLNERDYYLITVKTINRWSGIRSTNYGLGIPGHGGASSFRYKLNNRMPYVIGQMLPGAGLYNILFTDYDQFAIVWSCSNYSIAHSDRIWVLGRRREIEAGVRARIYNILQELNLDPDRLILSKNNNCTSNLAINQINQI